DRNRSHWSTSKTPSYTKSVSWQHHRKLKPDVYPIVGLRAMISSIFGVDAQEAMMLLQAMIGLKMINVDLSYPILETGLIKIISNDHYIGLNANGYY
ncbi:hypothetical protein OBN83_18195, partial [Escherichia coli]|nr:hypothetical protein [Escherichia coli]MCU7049378.1 hypothetical protein [Escherichia coli]